MVLELAGPPGWPDLARAWQGVQADLGLPAPAIAVSGRDGHQLWFSLAQPVPAAQALEFLAALRQRYLPDVEPGRVSMRPCGAAPPVEVASGQWSAFVAPDLAALFADEPWLDLPPSAEAQADLLSRLASTTPDDWRRALERLQPPAPAAAERGPDTKEDPATPRPALDPRRFLLDVMSDPAMDMRWRIEAAKALLPDTAGRARA
jgi:hypothetical protein